MRRAGRPRSTQRGKILETFATRGGEKPDEWILAGFSKPLSLSLTHSVLIRWLKNRGWKIKERRRKGSN